MKFKILAIGVLIILLFPVFGLAFTNTVAQGQKTFKIRIKCNGPSTFSAEVHWNWTVGNMTIPGGSLSCSDKSPWKLTVQTVSPEPEDFHVDVHLKDPVQGIYWKTISDDVYFEEDSSFKYNRFFHLEDPAKVHLQIHETH